MRARMLAVGLLGIVGCGRTSPVEEPASGDATDRTVRAPTVLDVAGARASPTVTNEPPNRPDDEGEGSWDTLVPGLRHARRSIQTGADTPPVFAEVFVADLSRMRLVALDAAASRGANEGGNEDGNEDGDRGAAARVGSMLGRDATLVVVNGTFFDREGAAMGLLRQGTHEWSPLRAADWGVLEVAGGAAQLVHTRDYRVATDVEFAVQCGPRVVIDGRVPSLKPQVARRTALCVRGDGTVAMLVTEGPIEADALGRWLAAPEVGTAGRTSNEAGLGCRDALLLDGGPSTQLAAAVGDRRWTVPGGWGVPNGIGIAPR